MQCLIALGELYYACVVIALKFWLLFKEYKRLSCSAFSAVKKKKWRKKKRKSRVTDRKESKGSPK